MQTLKNLLENSKLFRVTTDIVIGAFALFAAFMSRFLVQLSAGPNETEAAQLFSKFCNDYLRCLPIVLIVCFGAYYFFGFYNKGRYYTGRYKLICVLQAVSVAYLIIALVAFMTQGTLISRSVLPIAWLITTVITAVSRIWTLIWRKIVLQEEGSGNPKAKLKISNVLVIGGSGYIGSALLKLLLERGYRVRILDLFLYGYEPINEVKDHPNLDIKEGDLRRVEHVVEAMQGMDAVIHLGALVGDPACALDEKLTLEVNLMATRLVAEVAKANKVQRLIFASTCSVYGANDEILNEHSELNPVSLYAKSKVASERVLSKLKDDVFTPVIVRFGTIYGLSGRTRFDLVVNLLTAKAIVDGEITLYGGKQWRPFIHVEDAARAVFLILETNAQIVGGETFNVGSNEQNMTLQQVGELVNKLVPSAKLKDLGSSDDPRNYRVSFDKIFNLIGFKPRWSMEEGVKQVIKEFKTGRIVDYKDSKYSNVDSLSNDLTGQLNYTTGWENALIDESGPIPDGNLTAT
jgi:nucleoside-diphosphate-sugar epimerase